jgi:hypothetical protein
VTDLGGAPGAKNLLVGHEEGRVLFFRHEDIAWRP